ncbi:MAG: hypothetical protein ACLQU1_32795 [Bryobacteraceae bacterium]
MARLVVSVLFAILTSLLAQAFQSQRFIAIVLGLIAGSVTWALNAAKLAVEIRERYYAGRAKRNEVELHDRRITLPTKEEVSKYGVPYKSREAALWLAISKASREQLKPKEFISGTSETEIDRSGVE